MTTRKPKPPRKLPYDGRRRRKYLRDDEVSRLIDAARSVGNNRERDATLILMMYRHGLRVSEAISITWDDVDLEARRIFVRRLKNGKSSTQALNDEEVRALSKLHKATAMRSKFVFANSTKLDGGLTRSTAYKLIVRAGKIAKLSEVVNSHMLRHSCGYHLINVRQINPRRIQDYLGHSDINHTVAYTELDERKFDGLWGD